MRRNVYITSQYFFPAIIYRDIISHITITYRYIMYFFRTFKKSTAPYKVHNMGLRYIITINVPLFKKLRDIMAHKVILPPQKNYIPQFLKQRDINSYYLPETNIISLRNCC